MIAVWPVRLLLTRQRPVLGGQLRELIDRRGIYRACISHRIRATQRGDAHRLHLSPNPRNPADPQRSGETGREGRRVVNR